MEHGFPDRSFDIEFWQDQGDEEMRPSLRLHGKSSNWLRKSMAETHTTKRVFHDEFSGSLISPSRSAP